MGTASTLCGFEKATKNRGGFATKGKHSEAVEQSHTLNVPVLVSGQRRRAISGGRTLLSFSVVLVPFCWHTLLFHSLKNQADFRTALSLLFIVSRSSFFALTLYNTVRSQLNSISETLDAGFARLGESLLAIVVAEDGPQGGGNASSSYLLPCSP